MIYWILLLFASTHSQAALNLDALYAAAVKNTSAVKAKVLDEQVAIETRKQAYSEVLPTISLNSDSTWREPTSSSSFNERAHVGYLSLSQPLFQGGGEYYALSIARRLPKIAEENRRGAEIQLYTNVARAFYTVYRFQREKEILTGQEKILVQRVSTLQQRARIGRNKKTDVLAARSRLARVRADIALIESELLDSRLRLQNLTGLSQIEELQDESNIEELNIPQQWDNNFANNPSLKSLQLSLESVELEAKTATMEFMPTVSLGANYYFERDGFLSDSDWDVSVNATWEIFSGGDDFRERRIKNFELEKEKAELTDFERNLQNSYQTAKKNFLIKKDSVAKLKAAADIARINYQEHLRESNKGLVSQLDVLRVLEESLEAQRAFERQLYDTKISFIELKEIAGVGP